ncbi:unnamed protein product, partial [Polarella glacialis]
HVFVFGGWGHGPMGGSSSDLHYGPLAVPLELQPMRITGTAPPRSYEAKLTVLEEDEDSTSATSSGAASFRAVVSGGYLHGGYDQESSAFGVLEISFSATGAVSAKWTQVGQMTPRSNHSATFIPPRAA